MHGELGTQERAEREGLQHMGFGGGVFLASKPSAQTDFTAGSHMRCQRCHAKMGYHTGLLLEKWGGMVSLGTSDTSRYCTGDSWGPAFFGGSALALSAFLLLRQ